MRAFPCLLILLCAAFFKTDGQVVSKMISNNIASAQLFSYGNQQGFPVYTLNSGQKLQLEFDDLEGGYKNYYFNFILCDYNWSPCNLSPFDYLKGFTMNRITNYRNSNIALTNYTHYQAFFPDNNSTPTKSGNYLLKVFLDGDTSKIVFTKQFIVVEDKAKVSAEVIQPFNPALFYTHQQIKFSATISGINSFSAAQQVRAVILQNNRWDNALRDINPSFIRGNALEFTRNDLAIFPAGKEWRWVELSSLRLLSDRVDHADFGKTSTDFYLKTDVDKSAQRYVYFPDLNGMYELRTLERRNPFTQGDYATVHFSFASKKLEEDLFLIGSFTNYHQDDKWKMSYNEEKGLYEASAFLKQGYYNYSYMTSSDDTKFSNEFEGNYFETENSYTIILYYRGFADRCDKIIGFKQFNSRLDRPGMRF